MPPTPPKAALSPAARLFLRVMAAVFLAEALVMFLLARLLPPLGDWLEILVDSTLLTLAVTPLFWRWLVVSDRQRRRAEEKLQESNESQQQANVVLEKSRATFRALFEEAADALVVVDHRGRIVRINRMAEKLFGYTRAELLDQPVEQLMPEGSHARHVALRENYQASPRFRDMGGTELRGRRKDGGTFPADIMLSPLETEEGDVVLATVRDLTARRLAEEALKKPNASLLQANARLEEAIIRANQLATEAEAATQAKSEFLANMSHEIRTPMNAIVGMTGLLLDTSLTTEQHEFAQTVRQSGDTLLTLINDVLDFSKIESGKLELEHMPVDVRDCIESTLDLVAPRAAGKWIDLVYWMESAVPVAVLGDVTRLRQVLVNLAGNAVKFTEHGEVLVSVSVRTDAEQPGRLRLHFAVKDTGIGIPAEAQQRLFKVFSQVDASTTRRFGGTGLGLAISQRLVELMGGRIWVESEEGKGSVFQFEIPLEPAEESPRTYVRGGARDFSGRRLLIIDDNATNRRILMLQAKSWGLFPQAAASGPEALAWIERGDPFDLAIVDFQMPGMDGFEVIRAIRRFRPESDLPVLLLTSLGQCGAPPPGLSIGLTLTKPIKASSLFNALQRIWFGHAEVGRVHTTKSVIADLAQRNPLHILLAEDNVVNQRVALLILDRMGYRADIAANGLEVLTALRRQPYDVVLLDVQMPELDGLQAAREICRLWPPGIRPRMVAMTANAMQGDREECLAVGMDDYLAKPVRPEALAEALAKCKRLAPP